VPVPAAVQVPTGLAGPGPGAEWFYLDTRPMSEGVEEARSGW
jgi:hypothetical protein